MALISLHDVGWGFGGGAALLEGINLQIESGERICLVGRNGTGKSSLLKLIGRRFPPDSGEILHPKGMSIGVMAQEVPQDIVGTVSDVVARGLDENSLVSKAATASTDADITSHHHDPIDHGNHWRQSNAVEAVLSRTGLDPEWSFAELSAGLKRRTFFARALVSDPDILLLDEPTNHLDIQAIEWMETFILRNIKTLLFVTHDRSF